MGGADDLHGLVVLHHGCELQRSSRAAGTWLLAVGWRRTDFRILRTGTMGLTVCVGPEGNVRGDRDRPQGRFQFPRGEPAGSFLFPADFPVSIVTLSRK